MSISKGSGQMFFSPEGNFTLSRKFSSISIPEIAKTDLAIFEKSQLQTSFLTLSGINVGVCKSCYKTINNIYFYLIFSIHII
jgi:hypothetical protein